MPILVRRSALLVAMIGFLFGCATVGATTGHPVIIAGYGTPFVMVGGPHAGVDFAGVNGRTPVIAAADGVVVRVTDHAGGCGKGITIAHVAFNRYTAYCHLHSVLKFDGEEVKRGEMLGLVGSSGNATGFGIPPHVHMELCTILCSGSIRVMPWHLNPEPYFAGCFQPSVNYPTERLVLTYPTPCG